MRVRILLDSHVIIWSAEGKALPPKVQTLLEDEGVPTFISIASLWELSIKVAMGRLHLPEAPEAAVQRMSASELPIVHEHLKRFRSLPPLHKDPFDRLLVAQAIEEGLVLVTSDRNIHRYPVAWLW